jgi:hypothetical protein
MINAQNVLHEISTHDCHIHSEMVGYLWIVLQASMMSLHCQQELHPQGFSVSPHTNPEEHGDHAVIPSLPLHLL